MDLPAVQQLLSCLLGLLKRCLAPAATDPFCSFQAPPSLTPTHDFQGHVRLFGGVAGGTNIFTTLFNLLQNEFTERLDYKISIREFASGT